MCGWLVVLAATICVGRAAPQDPSSSSMWHHQNIQSLLSSIDERLRSLDTLYAPRYTSRWEMNQEQQTRRLEAIESRISRLETLIELRLDKLTEAIGSKQLKEELSRDQMNRKVDAAYERFNHRLGYMEAHINMGITKLKTTTDTLNNRFERFEMAINNRQIDTDSKVDELNSGMNSLRRKLESQDQVNNGTMTAIFTHNNDIKTHLENFQKQLNKSLLAAEQNDAEVLNQGDSGTNYVEKITDLIDKQASNMAAKINNMYNELWRRNQAIESLVKDSMVLSNATRRDVQEGLRSLLLQMGRRGIFQHDRHDREKQTGPSEIIRDDVMNMMQALSRKLDNSFQMLMLAQNLFLESCHRIQLDEPQIETKLTQVLERIADTVYNRSLHSEEIHELIKSHHRDVIRTISHGTNTVMKLADDSTKDKKHLENVIRVVSDNVLTTDKEIQNAFTKVVEQQISTHMKVDQILEILQEIQEQVGEITENTEESREAGSKEPCFASNKVAANVIDEIQKQGEILYNTIANFQSNICFLNNKQIVNITLLASKIVQEMKKTTGFTTEPYNQESYIIKSIQKDDFNNNGELENKKVTGAQNNEMNQDMSHENDSEVDENNDLGVEDLTEKFDIYNNNNNTPPDTVQLPSNNITYDLLSLKLSSMNQTMNISYTPKNNVEVTTSFSMKHLDTSVNNEYQGNSDSNSEQQTLFEYQITNRINSSSIEHNENLSDINPFRDTEKINQSNTINESQFIETNIFPVIERTTTGTEKVVHSFSSNNTTSNTTFALNSQHNLQSVSVVLKDNSYQSSDYTPTESQIDINHNLISAPHVIQPLIEDRSRTNNSYNMNLDFLDQQITDFLQNLTHNKTQNQNKTIENVWEVLRNSTQKKYEIAFSGEQDRNKTLSNIVNLREIVLKNNTTEHYSFSQNNQSLKEPDMAFGENSDAYTSNENQVSQIKQYFIKLEELAAELMARRNTTDLTHLDDILKVGNMTSTSDVNKELPIIPDAQL